LRAAGHLTLAPSLPQAPASELASGNTVAGSAAVSSNSGCTFTNNTISGALAITNNTRVFVYSGNTVHGSVTNSANT
jgi:hypothetical protein